MMTAYGPAYISVVANVLINLPEFCVAVDRPDAEVAKGPCAQELIDTADIPAGPSVFKPVCTENGHYKLIQDHGPGGFKWCVHPISGVKIEGTEVPIGKGDPTCPACVVLLAQIIEKNSSGEYRPRCNSNGNFKRLQTNASTGLKWCVDRETGKKTGNAQRFNGKFKCDDEQ